MNHPCPACGSEKWKVVMERYASPPELFVKHIECDYCGLQQRHRKFPVQFQ